MHWAFETYSKKITPCSLKQFYLGFYILEIRTKFVFGYTQNIYLSKNNHIILDSFWQKILHVGGVAKFEFLQYDF